MDDSALERYVLEDGSHNMRKLDRLETALRNKDFFPETILEANIEKMDRAYNREDKRKEKNINRHYNKLIDDEFDKGDLDRKYPEMFTQNSRLYKNKLNEQRESYMASKYSRKYIRLLKDALPESMKTAFDQTAFRPIMEKIISNESKLMGLSRELDHMPYVTHPLKIKGNLIQNQFNLPDDVMNRIYDYSLGRK